MALLMKISRQSLNRQKDALIVGRFMSTTIHFALLNVVKSTNLRGRDVMDIEQIKQVLQYGDLNTKDKDILTKAWLDTLSTHDRLWALDEARALVFRDSVVSYCPFSQSERVCEASALDKDYFITLYRVILFRFMMEALYVK